jgi:hypothetical protein
MKTQVDTTQKKQTIIVKNKIKNPMQRDITQRKSKNKQSTKIK